jgi:dolichol-phosphate mannosyltransferase
MISLVIPTYKEAAVIEETLRRAAAVFEAAGEEFELIVVDDASGDGTAELAEAMARELPVRVLRRPGRMGLATAVVAGWHIARGDVLGIMDADLQHPPEVLKALATALRAENADLAVASRYVKGGGTSGWSWIRRLISWAGVRLGAAVLPWTLGDVKDFGSGMFLVRAAVITGVELKPLGIKTLLEVLAKGRYGKLVEVPYVFQGRARGESKLGARQHVEYLQHLARVGRASGEFATWIRYAVVGLLGAGVNLGALYLFAERVGWPLGLALPVAIELALLSNFLWNNAVTFRACRGEARDHAGVFARLWRYEKLCLPGALLNGVVTFVLAHLALNLIAAAAVGIVTGSLSSFVFTVSTIWRIWGETAGGRRPGELSMKGYDLGGGPGALA